MSKIPSNHRQVVADGTGRLREKLIPLLALLLVIAITVSLHLVYGRHPERLEEFKEHLYWGTFVISLIGNATIILPGAVLVIVSNIGALVYPLIGPFGPIAVGLVGGTGAAIGEITGYIAGYSGRGIAERRKMYSRVEGWVRKWGALTIFVFSLVPFVFDLAGIAAGALRFPFWKFFLICWLGRTLLYVFFALLAAFGLQTLLPYLS